MNVENMKNDKSHKKIYYFRCSKCHFREQIVGSIDGYLEENLTSTGCCKGCGTKKWSVINNYNEIVC